MAEYRYLHIIGASFEVTTRYTNLQPVYIGTGGLVCAAKDQLTRQIVAIKKITKPFSSIVISRQAYRELKVLRHLQHQNVIGLRDVFISPVENMYLITEFPKTDLERVLMSEPLENGSVKYFLYQILRGLKYIHSAGIIHRNLRSGNILIDENCNLRISNFGLARIISDTTDYDSISCSSSSKILPAPDDHGNGADIWSAGCILAEMLEGKPLFPGKDYRYQFSSITEFLGAIPDDVIENIWGENTLKFVYSLPKWEYRSLSHRFKNADPLDEPDVDDPAINLLNNMLSFDQQKRVHANEALTYEYLIQYYNPTNEPISEGRFKLAFKDSNLSVHMWKRIIHSEIQQLQNGCKI